MAVNIALEKDGITKMVPVGFSWTTLFFGFFVPLFRGDIVWFIVMLALSLLSFGLINFILCFLYNRIYVNKYLKEGWRPADEYAYSVLRSKSIIV